MTPELWKKVESVFEIAVELPPSERKAFLDNQKDCHVDVRKEVEKLLKNVDSADSFLESPVWTDSFFDSSVRRVLSDSLDDEKEPVIDLTGTLVGPYRLVSEIGRGGMGAVYLGERVDGEFSQEVAIKLLKRGLDSDFIIKRFRHERQILASFEHPFISRLLDGGTLPDGIPYFVMEYIRGGVSIYDWCDDRRLGIEARLKLFLKVCSALEYAHERKIIHRDIKPGNILINRSGAPKLLDFGIAKILDPDLIHESFNPTASLVRMMTPDYASPEQIRGFEITPASDIYSLGVLLYELVSGHRPYELKRHDIQEISRAVCDVEPVPPSAALNDRGTLLKRYRTNVAAAEARNSTPEQLAAVISHLDHIVLRALAKDPADRFLTLAELSGELSELVRSGVLSENVPAASGDQGTAGGTGLRSVAVLPFRVITFSQEGDTDDRFIGAGLAESLVSRLGRIHKFLVVPTASLNTGRQNDIDPVRAGRTLKADYILDGSIKRAGDRLRLSVQLLDVSENAAVWATSIDERAGDILSLEETLSNQLIEALVPRLSITNVAAYLRRGTDSPEAFENYLRGRYHFSLLTEDHLAKAFVLFHRAVAADPGYAHAYCGIANYYNWLGVIGVLSPVECFRPALEAARKAVELDPNLSEAHASLGFSLHVGAFDWKGAGEHFEKALEFNPNNASANLWYSTFLSMSGRFEKGLEYAKRAVELDPLTPYTHYNVGSCFYYARRFREALAQHQKVVDEFPDYGIGYYGLSKLYRVIGDTKVAIELNDRALELLGETIIVKIAAAECLAADGQRDGALAQLAMLQELSLKRFVSPYMLSMVYVYLKDSDAVLTHLERSFGSGEAWLACAPVEARLEPFFREERFRAIMRAVNHPLSEDLRRGRPAGPVTRTLGDLTTILIERTD